MMRPAATAREHRRNSRLTSPGFVHNIGDIASPVSPMLILPTSTYSQTFDEHELRAIGKYKKITAAMDAQVQAHKQPPLLRHEDVAHTHCRWPPWSSHRQSKESLSH